MAKTWNAEPLGDDFDRAVLYKSKLSRIVVAFWACWCQPSRLLAAVLEDLFDLNWGRFLLVKVNTEQLPYAPTQFELRGIPSIFVVLDEEVATSFDGALARLQIEQWLNQFLDHSTLVGVTQGVEKDPLSGPQSMVSS